MIPCGFFNDSLRFGQVSLIDEVPLRRTALHFVTGYMLGESRFMVDFTIT